MENLAAWMSDNGEVPSLIYSGPRARTFGTAEILRKEIGLPKVIVEDGLGPDKGNALAVVLQRILADKSLQKIAIVSDHETIARGLSWLVGMESHEYEIIGMAEMRILKVDRKDGYWKEKSRVLPSDLGGSDYY